MYSTLVPDFDKTKYPISLSHDNSLQHNISYHITIHIYIFSGSCFDNAQLKKTAHELEGLLGTLIRGVEQRATLKATKTLV